MRCITITAFKGKCINALQTGSTKFILNTAGTVYKLPD